MLFNFFSKTLVLMPISHLLLCSNLRWPFDSCFGEFEMGNSKVVSRCPTPLCCLLCARLRQPFDSWVA